MRKYAAALILTVIMMALAGCGGGKSPVVGEWKMTEMETMGVKVSIEEYMKSMGSEGEDMQLGLTLKDDGTFTGNFAGEEGNGTWEYKDPTLTLTSEGEEMKCEYKGGKLVMEIEEGGQTISAVFEK